MIESTSVATITNFGGNKRFHPAAVYAPRSEPELLEILRANRGQRMRAVGRLHSWSDAPVCEEILINLKYLNAVAVHVEGPSPWVEVGAGCQIKRLINELQRQGRFTLPTLGLITEQTIAGAMATGTHGSGRPSLSHYPQAVRLACFDPATREPVIRVIDGGAELRAARCSLGCLGIVTSVRLPIRPQYVVEEHFRLFDVLQEVLEQEHDSELQQFFLLPWRWNYFGQCRRETDLSRSWYAPLYRLYWLAGMDVGFHLIIRLLARVLPGICTRVFFRWILAALVPRRWRVVDRSDRQLTMKHELFQHIEIELFVTRSRLPEAAQYVTWLLKHLGGESVEPEASVRERLQRAGCWDAVWSSRATYLHRYPICFRKVLPDDALISMASGWEEPCYAISFISYAHPRQRDEFIRFAELLAKTMATLFDARPHWGKVCPLPVDELRRLYPKLGEFAAICDRVDPTGVFRNNWLAGIIGRNTGFPSTARTTPASGGREPTEVKSQT